MVVVLDTFDVSVRMAAVLGNPCGKAEEMASFLLRRIPLYSPEAATSLLHVLH